MQIFGVLDVARVAGNFHISMHGLSLYVAQKVCFSYNFMRRTTQLARTHVEVMWFCSIELCATSYSSTKPRAGY